LKLDIRELSKRFGDHTVLDRISLMVENCRSLALIGPSGGGKSTLLRIIAGLETPEEGSLEVNGRTVNFTEKELREHRLHVGVVFQAYNLFPHLTALQNITLPLEKVHGSSRAEALALAMESLHRFRLADHAQKKPAELSGGQQQRIAIARAIAIKPRLLLFDEPTSALDPEMTAEVLDVIEELKEEGRDFVLVTHEMGFARSVADKLAFLAGGRILESGASAEVFDSPRSGAARVFLARILKY
jgi:polar amino acid transport system ATP-binding protein